MLEILASFLVGVGIALLVEFCVLSHEIWYKKKGRKATGRMKKYTKNDFKGREWAFYFFLEKRFNILMRNPLNT